jgi:sodium-coupled neutral amino acid transporter 2
MAQTLVKNGNATYMRGDLEKHPLLASIKKEEEQQYDGYNRASVSSAVFSLSTTIVGAGIMGLPSTMNVIGLVPGCIMLVSLGFLTNTSIEFLLRYSCKSKVVSYGGVMADSFGRFGRTLLQISVIFNNFGLLVVYLIIIGMYSVCFFFSGFND